MISVVVLAALVPMEKLATCRTTAATFRTANRSARLVNAERMAAGGLAANVKADSTVWETLSQRKMVRYHRRRVNPFQSVTTSTLSVRTVHRVRSAALTATVTTHLRVWLTWLS